MMQVWSRAISSSRPGYPDLREIVPLIPPNGWVWTIFEFNAFGPPFKGLPLEEFESQVLNGQLGCQLSYDDLVELADVVEQTVDILAVAANKVEDFGREDLLREEFGRYNFVVQIIDSSEVLLGANDRVCDAVGVLREFTAL